MCVHKESWEAGKKTASMPLLACNLTWARVKWAWKEKMNAIRWPQCQNPQPNKASKGAKRKSFIAMYYEGPKGASLFKNLRVYLGFCSKSFCFLPLQFSCWWTLICWEEGSKLDKRSSSYWSRLLFFHALALASEHEQQALCSVALLVDKKVSCFRRKVDVGYDLLPILPTDLFRLRAKKYCEAQMLSLLVSKRLKSKCSRQVVFLNCNKLSTFCRFWKWCRRHFCIELALKLLLCCVKFFEEQNCIWKQY